MKIGVRGPDDSERLLFKEPERMYRISFSLVLLVTLIGCGGDSDLPDLGSVTGTVTLDGKPLPNATVEFTPVDGGRPSVAMTEDDGEYELEYTPGNFGATPGS